MLLGTKEQLLCFSFFFSFLLSARGQEDDIFIHHIESAENELSYSVNDNGTITISYSISEISLQNLKNEHGSFYRISIPEHITTIDPGLPELPVLSKLITVPEGCEIKAKITEIKSFRLKPPARKIRGMLYPAQEGEVKLPQSTRRQFVINREVYKKRDLIKSDTVSFEMLGKARNNYLANIYIRPVRYNPGKNSFEVISSMKIEISFSKAYQQSTSTGSFLFDQSLAKGAISSGTNLVKDYSDVPVGMIILTDTMFKKDLAPFIEWKTRKGFRIKVLYRGATFAGTTCSEIRETLKTIYNSSTEKLPAPDYLLIVGDISKVPNYSTGSGNATDLYYGEFDGNGDYFPEMYIGRLPVKDTSDLRSVVKKIIQYEKFEFPGTNSFYGNALATTGYDYAHKSYMDGQVRYSVTNYLTPQNRISEFHFYHSNETVPEKVEQIMANQKSIIIDTLLNKKGLSFINYSGHGSSSGWKNLNLFVSDVAALKNKSMYPFIISNACQTGQFHKDDSFSNRMLLEKNKGAIAVIGCSNDSYWDEDYFYSVGLGPITENPSYSNKGPGIFDRFFHTHNESPSEWYYTIGQVNYAGNLSVSASTSIRKKYYWETYNIVGDPSIIPIIGKPAAFNISLPDTLPNGIRSLTLNAEPFSYVAISHFDTLWDASFASSSGSVILDIPETSDDSCLIVITGQNKYPIIKTIYFSELNAEFLNLDSYAINDSDGNKDGKIDYEENFYLSFLLNNLGNKAADSVYAKVISRSEWLSVVADSIYIGTITPGSKINFNDKLRLRVTGKVPDLQVASVNLVICSSENTNVIPVDMLIHSPVLRITAIITNDIQNGNGDFIAEPGENIDLEFVIRNEGSSDASIDFKILPRDQGITIPLTEYGPISLKSGEVKMISVPAELSNSLVSADVIRLLSTLSTTPYSIEEEFTLRVGRIRESFEAGSFKVFPWINNSNVPWVITSNNASDGIMSARSGSVGNNASTKLAIRLFYNADDTFKFRYKISSEKDYDKLSFTINNKEILKDNYSPYNSGEVPWTTVEVPVAKGLNNLEWTYKKDYIKTSGSDCAWIDLIDFTTSGRIMFIHRDLSLISIAEPGINEVGQADLKVKVQNIGADTLYGFNLAYFLNDRLPESQFFNKTLASGDTITVTFKAKMDLSRYGSHKATVYCFNNHDEYLNNDTLELNIINTEIRESLSVYPNPFSDELKVYINSRADDNIKISIYDISGSLAYEGSEDILRGGNTVILNGIRLKPGNYFMVIRGKELKKSVPLIRIRR